MSCFVCLQRPVHNSSLFTLHSFGPTHPYPPLQSYLRKCSMRRKLRKKNAEIRKNLLRFRQKALTLQKKNAEIRKNLLHYDYKKRKISTRVG